jgi:hypothetical protein
MVPYLEAASPAGDVVIPKEHFPPLVDELDAALRTEGTAMIVDLEPCLGAQIAAELNHRRLADAVLVVPRWPHADAVLPVATLIDTLVEAARHLAPIPNASNVVFALDGARGRGIPHRAKDDHRVDNRYDLSPTDLPNLATLRDAGIRRVIKVSRRS